MSDDAEALEEEIACVESIFGQENCSKEPGERLRVRLNDRGLYGGEVWLRCLKSKDDFDVTSLERMDEREALVAVARSAATPGEPSIYAAAVAVNDALADIADAQEDVQQIEPPPVVVKQEPRLARTILYAHHIIAPSKRAGLKDLAKALGVTALVKIGWPGVIVLEGDDDRVGHFVNLIQKWRWKHLVVRGEQIAEERALPCGVFIEYGPSDMNLIAKTCRDAGLSDLFDRVFRRQCK